MNESGLESALYPGAFDGPSRPKGTVWFLGTAGRTKWKNPFEGLDIPTPPPRKPVNVKKSKEKKESKSQQKDKVKQPKVSNGKAKQAETSSGGPVKIRLVLNRQGSTPVADVDEEESSEAESSSQASESGSRMGSPTPVAPHAPSLNLKSSTPVSASRRIRNLAGSSDESDSSESEMEVDPAEAANRPARVKFRKERPPPISVVARSNSRSTVPTSVPRPLASPLGEWPTPTFTSTALPAPLSSPFPSHSLDNTTWAVRHDPDQFASIETSSSSSDEDMRESVEWGTSSAVLAAANDILIHGNDDVEDPRPAWSAEDEEKKVKEATDALRVLFPLSNSPDEEVEAPPMVVQYNQLDNRRPAPSDTSSLAESTSTATATARGGPLKSADIAASIALSSFIPASSPIPSPRLRSYTYSLPDTSPTQHLSKLQQSFEAADIEMEGDWLDESGELPVKAEDTFSDVDIGSVAGDAPTPEREKQLHTAAWAREAAAAANGSFRVKEEPEDYPSPITTEPDDAGYRASRASSSDSHDLSSRSSELTPFEMDEGQMSRLCFDDVMVGPESVTLEELDGWLLGGKADKTPQRGGGRKGGRAIRQRSDPNRRSGCWGSIGVGTPLLPLHPTRSTPASASKPSRSTGKPGLRRRRSSIPATLMSRLGADSLPTPPDEERENIAVDSDMEGVGPAELEQARVEAEEREEQHRRATKEKQEHYRALLDAYRQSVKETTTQKSDGEKGEEGEAGTAVTSPDGETGLSPWPELGAFAWGSSSSESINLATPTISTVPPAFLHTSLSSPELTSNGFLSSIFPQSLDPKALLSPPLGTSTATSAGSGAMMLDETLSQAEVEAVMMAITPSPSPSISPTPVEPPTSSNTTTKPVPIAKGNKGKANTASNTLNSTGQKVAGALSKLKPTQKKAAGEKKENAKSKKNQDKDKGSITELPTSLPPSLAPSTGGESSETSPTTPASAPPPSVSTSEDAKPTPKPAAGPRQLLPGIIASVVDNMPVYAHEWRGSKSKGFKIPPLLRRLDTDFVNATTLLLTLGIPASQHGEYLSKSSAWAPSHHSVPTQIEGFAYADGVPGTWVKLAEARELVQRPELIKKLKPDDLKPLGDLLREDLFTLFTRLVSVRIRRSVNGTFGPSVRPLLLYKRAEADLSTQFQPPGLKSRDGQAPATTTTTNPLLAASSNSKSAPNLQALSSSAPNPNPGPSGHVRALSVATPKGTLVRSAPATPPDGCPHPKRRRATIVGDMSPMTKIDKDGLKSETVDSQTTEKKEEAKDEKMDVEDKVKVEDNGSGSKPLSPVAVRKPPPRAAAKPKQAVK